MREVAVLKRELSRGERGRGKRYPAAIRQRAEHWAREQRQAGRSWDQIARELGVGLDTVRRWCVGKKAAASGRSLLPVRVVQRPAESQHLVVVSPNGFRVEGATLAEAATLLRALG
jgi:hypothetical protein